MFKLLKKIFKQKEDREEYLDFSDFTDVQIKGTQRIDSGAIKNKPLRKVSKMSEPSFLKDESSKNTQSSQKENISNAPRKQVEKNQSFEEFTKLTDVGIENTAKKSFFSKKKNIRTDDQTRLTDIEINLEKKSRFGFFKNLFSREKNRRSSGNLRDEHDKTIAGRFETVKFKVSDTRNQISVLKMLLGVFSCLMIGYLFYNYSQHGSDTGVIVKKDSKTKNKIAKKRVKRRKETDRSKKKLTSENSLKNKILPDKPKQLKKKKPFVEETDLVSEVEPVKKVNPLGQKVLKKQKNRKSFDRGNKVTANDLELIEESLSNEDTSVNIESLSDLKMNYYAFGSGLVYNCRGKHWACVDKINFMKCNKLSEFKPKRCHAQIYYPGKRNCKLQQIKMINQNLSSKVCN